MAERVTQHQLFVRCLLVAHAFDETFFSTDKKLIAWAQNTSSLKKHLVVDWKEAVDLNALVLDHAYGGWRLSHFSGSGGGESLLGGYRLSIGELYRSLRLAEDLANHSRRGDFAKMWPAKRDARRTKRR